MKLIRVIPFLFAFSALGQNILLTCYPDNQPFQGLTNWPILVRPVTWSTNTPGWQTNMALSNFNSMMVVLSPIYSNANRTSLSGPNSNYVAWFNVYTQMPLGIQDSSNRIATFNSLLSSWSSGTNTAAQTNSIVKQTIQNQSIVMTYLNQIIGYLSRLGPGLQQVYQPANDPVGN